MKQLAILTFIVFFVAACGGGADTDTGFAYDGPVTPAEWNTNAGDYRGQDGLIMAYQCDPNPNEEFTGFVWGSGSYSDDSSVCTAGVHAGAITFEGGGVVVFEIQPGLDNYESTSQNGVESSTWGTWPGSFRIMQ